MSIYSVRSQFARREAVCFQCGPDRVEPRILVAPPVFKRYTRLTSTFADFSVNGFTHLRLLRETPF